VWDKEGHFPEKATVQLRDENWDCTKKKTDSRRKQAEVRGKAWRGGGGREKTRKQQYGSLGSSLLQRRLKANQKAIVTIMRAIGKNSTSQRVAIGDRDKGVKKKENRCDKRTSPNRKKKDENWSAEMLPMHESGRGKIETQL